MHKGVSYVNQSADLPPASSFVTEKAPRTALAVMSNGTLLSVTVDGAPRKNGATAGQRNREKRRGVAVRCLCHFTGMTAMATLTLRPRLAASDPIGRNRVDQGRPRPLRAGGAAGPSRRARGEAQYGARVWPAFPLRNSLLTRGGATCTQAVNLDGGGSTTAVYNGRIYNRPTCADTPEPVCERAVTTIVCIRGQ